MCFLVVGLKIDYFTIQITFSVLFWLFYHLGCPKSRKYWPYSRSACHCTGLSLLFVVIRMWCFGWNRPVFSPKKWSIWPKSRWYEQWPHAALRGFLTRHFCLIQHLPPFKIGWNLTQNEWPYSKSSQSCRLKFHNLLFRVWNLQCVPSSDNGGVRTRLPVPSSFKSPTSDMPSRGSSLAPCSYPGCRAEPPCWKDVRMPCRIPVPAPLGPFGVWPVASQKPCESAILCVVSPWHYSQKVVANL